MYPRVSRTVNGTWRAAIGRITDQNVPIIPSFTAVAYSGAMRTTSGSVSAAIIIQKKSSLRRIRSFEKPKAPAIVAR